MFLRIITFSQVVVTKSPRLVERMAKNVPKPAGLLFLAWVILLHRNFKALEFIEETPRCRSCLSQLGHNIKFSWPEFVINTTR